MISYDSAKEKLDVMLECLEFSRGWCFIDWYEALNIAQKAIDKRIAKETIRLKTDVDQKIGGVTFKSGCTIHKCPECDNFLPRWAKYCPHCGQAIVFKQITSEEEAKQTLKEVE